METLQNLMKMENYSSILNFILASIACVFIILLTMKMVKFIWKYLIKKPIIMLIKFFKPELKNLFDLIQWSIKILKSKKLEKTLK